MTTDIQPAMMSSVADTMKPTNWFSVNTWTLRAGCFQRTNESMLQPRIAPPAQANIATRSHGRPDTAAQARNAG